MDIPLDEVIFFDCITSHPGTGAVTDADSTPTFAVYEEATDTDIGIGGNLTKRTSLTGNYRGTFTISAANGFEVGKWYSIIGSATVNAIAGKATLKLFRVVAAEAVVGQPNLPAITANWLTNAGIANDALTASKFHADVTTELQTGLATATNLAAIATTIGVAGAGLTAIPWNATWDTEVESEVADALSVYDPPTKAELDAAVANVSVDEIQISALADLFDTDSGTTFASAVAGSPVKEIVDNAGGGGGPTLTDIAETVAEYLFTHNAGLYSTADAGSVVKQIADNAGGASLSETGIAETVTEYMFTHNAGSYGTAHANSVVKQTADSAGGSSLTEGGIADAVRTELAVELARIDVGIATRSSHSAADVWTNVTRTLTAGTNIVLAKGTGVTGFTDLSEANVRTAVGLAAANLDTQLGALAGFIDTEIATILSRLGSPSDLGSGATVAGNLFDIDASTDAIIVHANSTGVVVKSFTTAGKAELQVEANDALVANGLDDIATTEEVVDALYNQPTADNDVADSFGALFNFMRNLQTAEIYVETTTTPFQMVWIKAGTGTLLTGTRLLVRKLYKADGTAITADTMAIGRGIA